MHGPVLHPHMACSPYAQAMLRNPHAPTLPRSPTCTNVAYVALQPRSLDSPAPCLLVTHNLRTLPILPLPYLLQASVRSAVATCLREHNIPSYVGETFRARSIFCSFESGCSACAGLRTLPAFLNRAAKKTWRWISSMLQQSRVWILHCHRTIVLTI